MSSWHRENPELAGTSADPWMMHDSYRKAMRDIARDCEVCGYFTRLNDDGVCFRCARKAA